MSQCSRCSGAGVRAYGDTSTWRRGMGGQSVTEDVCDRCWGTGHEDRPGPNLRKVEEEIRTLSSRAAMAEQERDKALIALRNSNRSHAATLKECNAAKASVRAAFAGRDDVWFWEGSPKDDPDSLSCPVVLEADTLREILKQKSIAEKAAKALRMGEDTSWPLLEVLKQLAEAAGHLLDVHSCDVHGYEGIRFAQKAAEKFIAELESEP